MRLHRLPSIFRRAAPVDDGSWVAMFAVRRDWPDGGHDYVGLFAAENRAMFEVIRMQGYWSRCAVRPRLSVAELSRREFELHRHRSVGRVRCLAPDCPSVSPRWAALVDGLVWS